MDASPISVRFVAGPPETTPAVAESVLEFDADEPGITYAERVRFETQWANVAVQPTAVRIPSVSDVPGAHECYTVIPVRIVNHSPFAVGLRRGAHPVATHHGWIEVDGIPWSLADGRYTLAAASSVAARLQLVYSRNLVGHQPPVIDTGTWAVRLDDPQQLSQYSDGSEEIRLEVRLVLPSPPV